MYGLSESSSSKHVDTGSELAVTLLGSTYTLQHSLLDHVNARRTLLAGGLFGEVRNEDWGRSRGLNGAFDGFKILRWEGTDEDEGGVSSHLTFGVAAQARGRDDRLAFEERGYFGQTGLRVRAGVDDCKLGSAAKRKPVRDGCSWQARSQLWDAYLGVLVQDAPPDAQRALDSCRTVWPVWEPLFRVDCAWRS